jgi:hypothetical protein
MRWRSGFIVLMAAMLVGCASSITTSVDYDRAADFSKYRTYNWLESGSRIGNPLAEKRLTSAIEQQLAAKGLTKSNRPDLLVAMHARLSKETQFTTTGFGYGPGRWRGGIATTQREEIPVGTLMVDLVDATAKELVWRGTASMQLDTKASAEKKDKETQEVVSKMFADDPPKR